MAGRIGNQWVFPCLVGWAFNPDRLLYLYNGRFVEASYAQSPSGEEAYAEVSELIKTAPDFADPVHEAQWQRVLESLPPSAERDEALADRERRREIAEFERRREERDERFRGVAFDVVALPDGTIGIVEGYDVHSDEAEYRVVLLEPTDEEAERLIAIPSPDVLTFLLLVEGS